MLHKITSLHVFQPPTKKRVLAPRRVLECESTVSVYILFLALLASQAESADFSSEHTSAIH